MPFLAKPGRLLGERSKDSDEQRGSASERGYGWEWQKARLAFLAAHPLCADCEKEGRIEIATVVDHLIPHRGDLRLFWDQNNWGPKCGRHHNQKTARGL